MRENFNPRTEEVLTEFERQRARAAEFEGSNWGKFLGAIGRGVAKGINAYSDVFDFSKNIYSKVSPVLNYNFAGTEEKPIQNALGDFMRQENQTFTDAQNQINKEQLDKLKATNPTSPLIPELEKGLNKEVQTPVDRAVSGVTWLDENIYQPYHENAAAYLLKYNPDVIREARESNKDTWALAREYANQVSFGQAAFDLAVGDSEIFDIDITDPEQRNWLFYEGDGLVGDIGKLGSGAADLGIQLADPLWVGGKVSKFARVSLLDSATVREATGINRLWQQSYFVEGEEALTKYNAQQEAWTATRDQVYNLQQQKVGADFQVKLIDEQLANPTTETNVIALTTERERLLEQMAELDQSITELNRVEIPTLAKGHDEFYNQLLDGRLKATDLVKHSRLERWGAMKTKMAEAYALAARSGDKRDLIDLDLAAMGIDPQAAGRLRARRESLITIIEDQRVQLKEFTNELKMAAGQVENSEQLLDEAYDNAYKLYQAYEKEDAFLNAAVRSENERVANAVGMMDPRAGSRFKAVEAYRANSARRRSQLQFQVFRRSDLARPVFLLKTIGERSNRYRPNNMVTLEGIDQADGYDELVAWLQNASSGKVAGQITSRKILGNEFSQKILDDFILAGSNRAAKENVLKNAEAEVIKKLLVAAGVQVPEGKVGQQIIDDFIDTWLVYKDKRTAILRDKAFYKDSQGNLVKAPLLKPELQYSYYMSDTRAMAQFISENTDDLNNYFKGVANRFIGKNTQIGRLREIGGDAANLLDQMWRFGVLARLGYPQRNVATEWLKFSIVGGMMKVFGPQSGSLSQMPTALRKSTEDWFSNKHAFLQRLSLRKELFLEGKFFLRMNNYFEYVQMNNDLRKAEILSQLDDMEYEKFVQLSDKISANPKLIEEQPAFIRNAHQTYIEMKASQEKLAQVTERWESLQKVKRRTGIVQVYGYEVEDAYFGTQGSYLKDALSSAPTVELMSTGMRQAGGDGKWLGVDAQVYPDDPEYYPNLSNYIQNRLINSPTALRVLETTIIDDDVIRESMKAKVIEDLRKNPAYRDEIRSTGMYRAFKDEIKEEEKNLRDALRDNGFLRNNKEEFVSKILTPEEVDLLDQGILPERFGNSSPEYVKAAKAEAKRIADEYDLLDDPAFNEKLSTFRGVFPLTKKEAKVAAEEGIVPFNTMVEGMKLSKLTEDEISAVISTGYLEAAGVGGHFAESGYRFYTAQELRDQAFKYKGRLYFQLPWAKQTKNDYIAEQMALFNENWGDIRGYEMLDQYLKEQSDWIQRNLNVDELLETLSPAQLLKLGVKEVDDRSIEERYFDKIADQIETYFPTQKVRVEISKLKAGESLTPARIRYLLMERGDNLNPITGDLLIDEVRKRARPFKKIEGGPVDPTEPMPENWLYDYLRKKDRTDVFVSKLQAWKKGFSIAKPIDPKPTPQWRTLTPEEQVRAIESSNFLRALDQELSLGLLFKNFRKRIFTGIGQMPEDNLVRWPFGATVYNNHRNLMLKRWRESGFEPTQADMYAMHTAARARAIAESRRYLYTAMRKLNGVGNIPFVAPFLQAATVGMKNWGRITWNDPSILARRVWMYNYINAHADYDKKNGNRTVTITMPEWLISAIDALPGNQSAYKGALRAFPELKFDTDSFNLLFPGMRLGYEGEEGAPDIASLSGAALEAAASSIGVGPAVVIGIEELVKNNPNIDQKVYEATGMVAPARWIIDKFVEGGEVPIRGPLDKIAPSENITADPLYYDVFPAILKRRYAIKNGVQSQEYARINLQLFMTYIHKMETGEMERRSISEIETAVAEETVALITLKGLANLTLPFIPQFTGEVNTMINVWREYQDKWKENAYQEFIEDYPDWWVVTASLSRNPGGVVSTVDAVNMAAKHSKLVSDVSGLGSDAGRRLIGMITNREGQANEFDPASRVWLIENGFYINVDPITGESTNPIEAIERAGINKGNYDYYKLRDQRDIAIKQYGAKIGKPNLTYKNTSDPFVASWNSSLEQWITAQAKNNPSWYTEEWEPKISGKIQPTAIRAARMLLADKAWRADQAEGNWVDQLESYIKLQDNYSKLYAKAKAAKNEDLARQYRDDFQSQIEVLQNQNETFKYYYERFFDAGDGVPYLGIYEETK